MRIRSFADVTKISWHPPSCLKFVSGYFISQSQASQYQPPRCPESWRARKAPAPDVPVQLDIVEAALGGLNLPWVGLRGVLHRHVIDVILSEGGIVITSPQSSSPNLEARMDVLKKHPVTRFRSFLHCLFSNNFLTLTQGNVVKIFVGDCVIHLFPKCLTELPSSGRSSCSPPRPPRRHDSP